MLDIIIVNWNSGTQLLEVVESIAAYHQGVVGKVVIVDNGSKDDSLQLVATRPVDIGYTLELVRNTVNIGFGAACNQGVKYCKSEYLLFLNPDAKLYPNTLQLACHALQSPEFSNVGIVGIQLIDETGQVSRSCARFPNSITFFSHALGLHHIGFFKSKALHMFDWDHLTTQYVDHVIGAFYIIKKTLFDQLQGFDERFFVYLEDLDLSLRAKQEGWSSLYLADVQAYHTGGGTSSQVKARRLFYSLRSKLLYAGKHFSFMGAVLAFFSILCVEFLTRMFFAILKISGSQLLETARAYLSLYYWCVKFIFTRNTKTLNTPN